MRKSWMFLIIVSFLIILASNSLLFCRVFARISGSVKSEDGKPIEGAKVILIFSEDGTKHELLTDKKGKWMKSNILPGKWTIGFIADRFEPQNISVELSAIKDNPPIEVRLKHIPKSPFLLGDRLYQEKNYAEALREYERVLQENPGLYQAYERIGLCYYRLNDLEKAIETFKIVLEKEPQSRDTLINLSAIYFEKGNLEEGMIYLQKLDEKSLQDPGLFYNIGILFFKSNQIDRAVDYLKKCINLDPGYVDGYYQLALAYLNKGFIEEAKNNLQKILELEPDSEKAGLARKLLESIK